MQSNRSRHGAGFYFDAQHYDKTATTVSNPEEVQHLINSIYATQNKLILNHCYLKQLILFCEL